MAERSGTPKMNTLLNYPVPTVDQKQHETAFLIGLYTILASILLAYVLFFWGVSKLSNSSAREDNPPVQSVHYG